jgi:DNA ligase (NAD+)
MQEIAIKNGASLSSSITSKTTMLVVGSNPGSKLEKAINKEIPVVTCDEFMIMLHLVNKELF